MADDQDPPFDRRRGSRDRPRPRVTIELTEEQLRDIIREEVEDVFHAHGFDHADEDLPPIH